MRCEQCQSEMLLLRAKDAEGKDRSEEYCPQCHVSHPHYEARVEIDPHALDPEEYPI